jgi:glutamine synthetase
MAKDSAKTKIDGKEYVLKFAKEHDVKFVWLWFTDILGFLKSFSIGIEDLEMVLNEGIGFDGSSIEGFTRIDESDMVAKPDPDTFQLLPWTPGGHSAVGRMFCDIYTPEGKPCDGDPRYILRRNLKKATDMGFVYYVGPELEYFYFKDSTTCEPLDDAGYFDMTPPDAAHDLRRDTVNALESMGIAIDKSHHEVARSQHEIDMRYTDALSMADNVMTYRYVVKEIAKRSGVYATFMPKPIFGINGSGMHVHQSLFKNGRNAFFDPAGKFHLSKLALSFLAGLLKYAPEFTSITSQWVNSYKRLVPKYEAPVYLSWALKNRSDLIRVPNYTPGKEAATRFEIRSPDPACNPYLTFSVLLAAGLAGVEQDLVAPEPVEENVYHMGEEERAKRGIGSLPASLLEAIQLTEKSDLVSKALGDHAFHAFLDNKNEEWDRFRTHVTDYELNNYLPVL